MRDRIGRLVSRVPGSGVCAPARQVPALALLLALFFLALLAAAGCGGGGGDEAAEGEGGEAPTAEGEETPARPAAPAPAPPPPPKPAPRPAPPKPGAKPGAKPEEPITVKRKKLPDNKIIEFLFKPEDIAKMDDAALRYPGAMQRRNIFRDIKYSTSLKNVADTAIAKASGLIAQISTLPAGAKNDVILKKAVESLKKAQAALKANNYLKAREFAEMAEKLAMNAIAKEVTAGEDQKELSSDFKYNGAYLDGGEWTAIITTRDPNKGNEVVHMKRRGETILDLNYRDPKNPNLKRTLRVEEIFEDRVVMRDLLNNKQQNVDLARDYKMRIAEAQQSSGPAEPSKPPAGGATPPPPPPAGAKPAAPPPPSTTTVK